MKTKIKLLTAILSVSFLSVNAQDSRPVIKPIYGTGGVISRHPLKNEYSRYIKICGNKEYKEGATYSKIDCNTLISEHIYKKELYKYSFFRGTKITFEYKISGKIFDPIGLYKLGENHVFITDNVLNKTTIYKKDYNDETTTDLPYSLKMFDLKRGSAENGADYLTNDFFCYETPTESGVLQTGDGKFETIFKVNYAVKFILLSQVETYIDKETAAYYILFKNEKGEEIKKYFTKYLEEVIPKELKAIDIARFEKCKTVEQGGKYFIVSSDGSKHLSRREYNYPITLLTTRGSDEKFIIAEYSNFLSGDKFISERTHRMFDLYHQDGTIFESSFEVYQLMEYADQGNNAEWNLKNEKFNERQSARAEQTAKEDALYKKQLEISYGSGNANNDKSKEITCPVCNGKGTTSTEFGSTKKTETSRVADVVNGKSVLVTTKTTTATPNAINFKCKRCDGTGKCSTN